MHQRAAISSFTFASMLLLLLPACGPEPTDAERFRELGGLVCSRRVVCDLIDGSERADCVDDFVDRSCADVMDCDGSHLRSEQHWEWCLEAVGDLECDKVEARLLPGWCITAWRDPDTLPTSTDAGPAW
jgi:hypothetical protein